MKRLLLLRHAKACRDKAGLDDFDRSLTARGRAAAIRMGHYLKEEGLVPAFILVSPAARTRETLELLVKAFDEPPEVHVERELYLAKAVKIFECVRRSRAASPLLVIGHNPGLEYGARALAHLPGKGKAKAHYDAMVEKYPTAALAVIAFDVEEWGGIEPGSGTLERFVRPKDLGDYDD